MLYKMGDTQELNTITTSVTSSNMVPSSNATLSNITERERMSYLQHLDAEKWHFIYPVVIYLLILMVIGVIGNSIVLVVYFKKFKPSTTRLFILTLATFDLLTCSLSIPGVIVELRYHYTFFFPALCKIFRASRMYFVLVSLFTLIIVAVDRYRKVCRPLKPQYTIRSAGLSVLSCNIIAVCLTILGAVVGGNRTVTTDRDDVTGSNCSYDDEFIGKPITKVYSGILFLMFIVSVTLLVVLYSLIGRQVWKHRRFRFNQAKPTASSSSGSQNATASTEMQNISTASYNKYKVAEAEVSSGYSSGAENQKVLDSSFSENRISTAGSTEKILSGYEKSPKQTKPHPKPKDSPKKKEQASSGGQKRSSSKTTITLFIITVVFIVSFLPFLILVALWGSDWNFVNGLHGYTFTVYKIFFHSYHVNNVVNCYIYGFCNPRFRNECKQLFCSRKHRK